MALPHYYGTLSALDREMVAVRLFDECPRELVEELRKLAEKEKSNDVVRVFIVFETIKSRWDCLEKLTTGGLLPKYLNLQSSTSGLSDDCKFRGHLALVTTEPPAPEQMIWWNLRVGLGQRFKEECFSIFVTCMLVMISYLFAMAVQMDPNNQEDQRNTSKYLRSFGFAIWAQVIV
jgi:hypothetical protein